MIKFLSICSILGLVGFVYMLSPADSNEKPELNPSPKVQYTLELNSKSTKQIWLAAKYRAVNKACNIKMKYAGGSKSRIYGDVLALTLKEGKNHISFYADKYLDGECGWRLGYIAIGVKPDSFTYIGDLLPQPWLGSEKKDYVYSCGSQPQLRCFGKDAPNFNSNNNDFTVRRVN